MSRKFSWKTGTEEATLEHLNVHSKMMMMQAASSFEVLVPVYHFTWHHISQHWYLQK